MEMESHHPAAHDKAGKFIGLQTAVIAMLLSIVTIMSHRAHTDTIIYGNESSNEWSHYQAKRIRAYQVEMNATMVKLLAPSNPEVTKALTDYTKQSEKYKSELEEIKTNAEEKAKEEEIIHHKASFYDLAEGILEVAMILS